jgi:hypothetical protein
MNFKQTSYDPDVWWRKYDDKNNEYIGTHTDDLLVISKDAKSIMDNLQKVYSIKNVEEPKYHLGVDYRKDDKGTWYMGTVTHTQEALKKVATTFGISTELVGGPENRQYLKAMGKDKTPMDEKLKPELDSSKLLDAPGHRNYQRLIGIGQWLLTIGRYDLTFAISSLSRFSAAPREGHLKALHRVFRYLNANPCKFIKIDPEDYKYTHHFEKVPTANKDWSSQYPDAREEIDHRRDAPARGKALGTVVYFDSNWAHDEATRRSITGVQAFIGNTPVSCLSKRQGAIATSTYTAEMAAGRVGTEEAIDIRTMLRSFGVPVKGKTILAGDNLGQLISVSDPGAELKKKQCHIGYNFIREASAASIIDLRKCRSEHNRSDPGTKALGTTAFREHYDAMFSKTTPKG